MISVRCNNCGHYVNQVQLDNKEAFKINDKFYVCQKCYFLYLQRAKEYLYQHPNAEEQIVSKMTGLPLVLIRKFIEEDDLIETVNKELLASQTEKEETKDALDEMNDKMRTIKALQDSLNQGKQSSMQRIQSIREPSKMRFLNSDHRRR